MKNHNKQNKKNRKKDLLAVVLLIAGLLLFGASIVWGLGRQQPRNKIFFCLFQVIHIIQNITAFDRNRTVSIR